MASAFRLGPPATQKTQAELAREAGGKVRDRAQADRYALFEGLLEAAWASTGSHPKLTFPTTRVSVSFEHDIATHKFYGRDGADQEPTGRQPMSVTMVIPFDNGIVPGPNETWQGPLFPDVFRAFLRAFADKSKGQLTHPELGEIWAVPKSLSAPLDAQRRGGTEVTATWVETLDTARAATAIADGASNLQIAKQLAASLEVSGADILALAPKSPAFQQDLLDNIRKIQAIFDQATIQTELSVAKLDALAYRLDKLLGAFERTAEVTVGRTATTVKEIVTADDPVTAASQVSLHPFYRTVHRLKEYTHRARRTVNELQGFRVRFYVTQSDLPLSTVAIATKSDVGTLLELNPRIAESPIVKQGTIVRYKERV